MRCAGRIGDTRRARDETATTRLRNEPDESHLVYSLMRPRQATGLELREILRICARILRVSSSQPPADSGTGTREA